MQSEETFLLKTFLLTNQLTGIVVQCQLNVLYTSSRELNISRALTQINSHFVNIVNCHIFYLDFNKRMHVFVGQFPFSQEILLKSQLFLGDSLQIRYRKIVSQSAMQQEPCPNESKKRKVKQRTIREAIDAVKQWRQLYEVTDEKGKRIHTLESAAQKVGFAKKTLDDYFNQLRQAQYYGFDFNRHHSDKIGILRRFVKECQRKQEERQHLIMEDENIEHKGGNQNDIIDKYLKDPNSSDDEDALF